MSLLNVDNARLFDVRSEHITAVKNYVWYSIFEFVESILQTDILYCFSLRSEKWPLRWASKKYRKVVVVNARKKVMLTHTPNTIKVFNFNLFSCGVQFCLSSIQLHCSFAGEKHDKHLVWCIVYDKLQIMYGPGLCLHLHAEFYSLCRHIIAWNWKFVLTNNFLQ